MANWTLNAGDWCHIDILSADSARSRQFYGDGVHAGVRLEPPASMGTVPYILAPDMDATLAAVERAGGEIMVRTTDLMGWCDFAQFRDPDGNRIGLW